LDLSGSHVSFVPGSNLEQVAEVAGRVRVRRALALPTRRLEHFDSSVRPLPPVPQGLCGDPSSPSDGNRVRVKRVEEVSTSEGQAEELVPFGKVVLGELADRKGRTGVVVGGVGHGGNCGEMRKGVR